MEEARKPLCLPFRHIIDTCSPGIYNPQEKGDITF